MVESKYTQTCVKYVLPLLKQSMYYTKVKRYIPANIETAKHPAARITKVKLVIMVQCSIE